MKKILLSVLAFIALSLTASADEVTIGNTFAGYALDSYPVYSYYECSETEFIYTAEDLEALGASADSPASLSAMAFAVHGGSYLPTHFTIWLQNTDEEGVADATISDTGAMTMVFENGDLIMEAQEGTDRNPAWQAFEFNAAANGGADTFDYTGGGLRVVVRSLSAYYCDPTYQFVHDLNKITDMTAEKKVNARLKYGYTESGMNYSSTNTVFPIVKFTTSGAGGSTDGISSASVISQPTTYYNLQGQRTNASRQGIVIGSNGKKVIR